MTRDLNLLLGRDEIRPDMTPALDALRGKRVLVTGAAGSIGSELSRQLTEMELQELCLVDQAETPLHELSLTLPRAIYMVSNCADPYAMERLFADFRPQIVFHAAAYKHVPMMERCPASAITNNIGSTRIIADLCIKHGADRMVMVSTDKAVNPTSVMGATKRACELYVQSHPGPTRFITTRFGNVLGSSGSVVPLFLRQLEDGGPLTVTHREVVRYFMLISEACRLVLLAAALGQGGEIFAFDMGRPVRIADLARRIITLWGKGHERISYTGLRPGEKLYEEVLTSDELTLPGPTDRIRVARVRPADFAQVSAAVNRLLQTPDLALLRSLVPEYQPAK